MKAVIYARVSSREQEQGGYSIDAQLRLLNEYAIKNGYEIVREFIEVETAKKAGRENFNLMIEFLKKNTNIEAVLCEKTDRLTRNFKDTAILDDLTNNQDINIILVKENTIIGKNSKSNEKFIFGIKALMAKQYVDNLSEETRKGMLEKAEQGIFPSAAPFGYKNIKIDQVGKAIKCIVPDDKIAPFIKKVFSMYASGKYSLFTLTKAAYEIGLRNKGGNKVGKSELYQILKNPIYYGDFRWQSKIYHGDHVPIIQKQLFDNVQRVLTSINKPKQAKRKFAYTKLIKCEKCGCMITAEIKKKRYVYYHCTGFKGKCGNTYIREEKLAKEFIEIISRITIDSEILELIKSTLIENSVEEQDLLKKKLGVLNSEKTKLENRLTQIYTDKLDGEIDEDLSSKMTEKTRKELAYVIEKIATHKNTETNYLNTGLSILELCNQAISLYLQRSGVERAELLHCILSNCTLNNGTLCPTYRKPFDLFAKGLNCSNWLPPMESNHDSKIQNLEAYH